MKVKFITIPEIIIALVLVCFVLSPFLSTFAAKLNVPDSLIGSRTLYLVPQATAPVCNATCEGKVYFNDTASVVTYCDGVTWQALGVGGVGGDKYAATKIVAASNSLGTTGCPAACTNPRADYTCDGTGDQAEIQTAINALGTTAGAVYLLEGTYNISGPINFDNIAPNDSNKTLIGTGKGTVLKLAFGDGISATTVSQILISQLMIDGNNSGGTGIYFQAVTNSKIDKVWIENTRGSYGGIFLSGGSVNNIISNNHIKANAVSGIKILSSTSPNNKIYANNVQSNNGTGIDLGSSNQTVYANNVQSNNGCGISTWNDNYIISGNNVQGNADWGISLGGSNHIVFGNNVQANTGVGIHVSSGSNDIISANNVQSSSGYGIHLQSSINYTVVTGNMIYNNGAEGIYFDSNADNNTISSNFISDTAGATAAIWFGSSDCDYNYFVGNQIVPWSGWLGAIGDNACYTKYLQKEKININREVYGPAADSTLNVTTSPKSYLALARTTSVTLNTTYAISNGTYPGDILFLEGTNDTWTITVPNNANTRLGAATRVLGLDDTLKLLWNGIDWIEIGNATN